MKTTELTQFGSQWTAMIASFPSDPSELMQRQKAAVERAIAAQLESLREASGGIEELAENHMKINNLTVAWPVE